MEVKRQRTTIFVVKALINGKCTKRIDIPFTPKTVTVNNVIYEIDVAPAEKVDVISTDLLNGVGSVDTVLTAVPLQSVDIHNPNLTFNLNGPVHGVYEFSLLNTLNGGSVFSLTFEE